MQCVFSVLLLSVSPSCDAVNGRFEITEEDGKQTLVVKELKLDDAADFTCKIGDRETSAKLLVDEGKLILCVCIFSLLVKSHTYTWPSVSYTADCLLSNIVRSHY